MEDLNVLFLTKPISSEVGKNDYNNVLDALIRTLSNQQLSLFDRQKPLALGLGLSYSMRHSNANLNYNFTYRETSSLK